MKKLSGWGNYPKKNCETYSPSEEEEFSFLDSEKVIGRGFGRSYGDSSIQPNKTFLTKNLNRILSFDEELGHITVQSGISSDEVLKKIIPKGWFLPVSPGTKYVSIGGMVASDVHGKNHHLEGSFGNHLISFKLKISNSKILECSEEENSDLFWATIGGMGLTGILLEVKFKLKKIESYNIDQEVYATKNLKEVMNLFEKYKDSTYTVAWVDCLAKGSSLGRSVFFKGEHSKMKTKDSYKPNFLFNINFFFPSWTMNFNFVKIFNILYFYYFKFFPKKETDGDSFFYPLDKILNWNKIYGKKGFIQYQFLVPKDKAYETIKEVLDLVSNSGNASFLSVLKLFGKKNKGLMSFPDEGYTLAMDFQIKENTFDLLNKLDQIILKNSGKIYLSKDSRLSSKIFKDMNFNSKEFKKVLKKYNIKNFHSLQSERLKVI